MTKHHGDLKLLVILMVVLLLPFGASADTLVLTKRNWLSTGADNSLTADLAQFQFRKSFIETLSEETNIHSHYKSAQFRALRNYTLTAQVRLADANGGIGVTFHSKYKRADQYYRLRSSPGEPNFHIAPHPDGVQLITEGNIDSGVMPIPGTWYNLKITVRTLAKRTRIRAKAWQSGTSQPPWQIDCSDTSPARIKSGRIGIWSMGAGAKRWRKLKVSVLG